MVEPEEDSYNAATALALGFEDEFYNKLAANSRETAPDEYYVKILDGEGLDNVTELTINGNTVSSEDTFGVSVGQNAFVEFNYFKVEEDGIYVALPIALFEMSNNSTITFTIGSKEYVYDFDGPANGSMTCAGVKSQNTNRLKMEGSDNT